jgi:hypothetical protein
LQRTDAVTAIQAAQVDVDWYDIGGAAGNYSLSTDYTVKGLQRGGNYGFRYRAINVNGPGPWSEIAVITAATIPTAPPAPQYVSSTASQIVLALSRSADDGGTAISDYELEIDQGNSADVRITSATSSFSKIAQYSYTTDGLQYTVDAATLGLTAGKLYRFRWRSLNFMGYSPYSDTVRIGLGGLPSAVPSGPTRRPNSAADVYNTNTSIGLQWSAVAADALPVYEYRVYVDDGNLVNRTEAYRGPLTYTVVTGLLPGVEYTFTVTAVNYNGEGANSSALLLRSCVPPSGVPTPTLFYSTETSVTLRWGQPDDDGGCEVSGYKMYRDDGAGGAITTPVSFDNGADLVAEPYKFEHVVVLGAAFAGQTVRFQLEATNSEGSQKGLGYLSALVGGVPSAPSSKPTRVESTRTSLKVEMPLVTANGGLTLDKYELWVDDGLQGPYSHYIPSDQDYSDFVQQADQSSPSSS